MGGSDYCHAHDPDPEREQTRLRAAKLGGSGYKGLTSLTGFKVESSLDIHEATRLIIQDLIRKGLKNSSINQYTKLTQLFMDLEKHAMIPAKIKELDKLIKDRKPADGGLGVTPRAGK